MPNMKAAEKALRKTKKNTAINAKIAADISKLASQVRKAVAAKDKAKAKAAWEQLQQKVDKAAGNGYYKKGASGRVKSRIARIVAAIA